MRESRTSGSVQGRSVMGVPTAIHNQNYSLHQKKTLSGLPRKQVKEPFDYQQ
jgi:hypothetical protein